LPTKDGGVIIYATRTNNYQNQGLISNFNSDFIVTKFDKYGNIVFEKIINKHSVVFSDDTIAYKYYRTSIFDIIELKDGGFLAISGGPILDTLLPQSIQSLDYSKSTMFTIFDKFGNILSTKINIDDTNSNDFYSSVKMSYDTENEKYYVYSYYYDTLNREQTLKIKKYDTLLNLLSVTNHFIDSIRVGTNGIINNPYTSLEILDSLIYLANDNTGKIQSFKIMGIDGSNKYSKNDLFNFISISLKLSLGLCETFGGDNYYQDYFKDNNNHIHLFNIQAAPFLFNPSCYDNLLTHLEFDLNGNIHKISHKIFRDSSTRNLRHSTESLFAIPQNDSLCNFLIFSADRKFDFYRFISYDFQKDSL